MFNSRMEKSKHQKGLKPFAIKSMALLMGICYLANPLHEQIRTVFHGISHLVDAPGTILDHPPFSNPHEHGLQEHGLHQSGEHRLASKDHEHTVLDLIDSLFDTSDKQDPENDTLLPILKWDKHITSSTYTLPHIHPIATSQKHLAMEQKVRKGYAALPDEPPQDFFPSL